MLTRFSQRITNYNPSRYNGIIDKYLHVFYMLRYFSSFDIIFFYFNTCRHNNFCILHSIFQYIISIFQYIILLVILTYAVLRTMDSLGRITQTWVLYSLNFLKTFWDFNEFRLQVMYPLQNRIFIDLANAPQSYTT